MFVCWNRLPATRVARGTSRCKMDLTDADAKAS